MQDHQTFNDRAMYDRIVAVVKKAFADAEPHQIHHGVVDSGKRTRVMFAVLSSGGVPSVTHLTGGGGAWELKVDCPEGEEASYNLCASNVRGEAGTVRCWSPSGEDFPAEQYLAWWEGIVEIDESARRRYEVTYKDGAVLPVRGDGASS